MLCKSMDWFLYDNGFRHERVNKQLQKRVGFLLRAIDICSKYAWVFPEAYGNSIPNIFQKL